MKYLKKAICCIVFASLCCLLICGMAFAEAEDGCLEIHVSRIQEDGDLKTITVEFDNMTGYEVEYDFSQQSELIVKTDRTRIAAKIKTLPWSDSEIKSISDAFGSDSQLYARTISSGNSTQQFQIRAEGTVQTITLTNLKCNDSFSRTLCASQVIYEKDGGNTAVINFRELPNEENAFFEEFRSWARTSMIIWVIFVVTLIGGGGIAFAILTRKQNKGNAMPFQGGQMQYPNGADDGFHAPMGQSAEMSAQQQQAQALANQGGFVPPPQP